MYGSKGKNIIHGSKCEDVCPLEIIIVYECHECNISYLAAKNLYLTLICVIIQILQSSVIALRKFHISSVSVLTDFRRAAFLPFLMCEMQCCWHYFLLRHRDPHPVFYSYWVLSNPIPMASISACNQDSSLCLSCKSPLTFPLLPNPATVTPLGFS